METRTIGKITFRYEADFSGWAEIEWGYFENKQCVKVPATALLFGLYTFSEELGELSTRVSRCMHGKDPIPIEERVQNGN